MQTLIMIAVNFIMLALFYLIVSLKLERSASEFREKKLRKEMAEIITEFNSSAERNISLLENRISILKNLLNQSGNLKSVDVELKDANFKSLPGYEKTGPDDTGSKLVVVRDNSRGDINYNSESIPVERKKSLIILTEKFNNTLSKIKIILKLRLFNKDNVKELDLLNTDELPGNDGPGMIGSKIDYKISKDVNQLGDYLNKLGSGYDEVRHEEESIVDVDTSAEKISKADISKMFSDTSDKYSLIADLYDNGHSMEDISHHSGIPIGEIRLVLNLQDS